MASEAEQDILSKVAEILNANSRHFEGNMRFEVTTDEEDNLVVAAYKTGTKPGVVYSDSERGGEHSSNGTMEVQFVLYADLISKEAWP